MTLPIERLPNTTMYENEPRPIGKILQFNLGAVAARWHNPTIYNPSIEFQDNGRTFMFCRLEEFGDEVSSVVALFEVINDGSLELVPNGPRFPEMQDPYYLGEFTDADDPEGVPWKIVGGVKITIDSETGKVTNWQDTYYRYKDTVMELCDTNNPEPFM